MSLLNGSPATVEAIRSLGLVNYGHFTSMRVDAGRVRGLAGHLRRLSNDSQRLFGCDLDIGRVRSDVRRALPDRTSSYVVRVTIFDPDLQLGKPNESGPPSILVTARPCGESVAAIRVRTTPYVRDFPMVKHVGLFESVRLRRLARIDGYDDVLFTAADDSISEGATWNVGFIQDDSVILPDTVALPGVTLSLVKSAVPFNVAHVELSDLDSMDAAFATNTTVGVQTISHINTVEYDADNPTVAHLQDCYASIPSEAL